LRSPCRQRHILTNKALSSGMEFDDSMTVSLGCGAVGGGGGSNGRRHGGGGRGDDFEGLERDRERERDGLTVFFKAEKRNKSRDIREI
jgi:hypothetical protein